METTDILIVGAGPTGMTAALSLAARGRDVMLIDKQLQGLDCSRALLINPESLANPGALTGQGAAARLVRGFVFALRGPAGRVAPDRIVRLLMRNVASADLRQLQPIVGPA